MRLTTLITTNSTLCILLLLSSPLLLSGCGQSGPLYIPGNPSTMAVPPEKPPEEDEEEQASDKPTSDQ